MLPIYTDLADPSFADPYRQHSLDDPIQPTLSFAYSYPDNPYLPLPRPHPDPARPPTPDLSFTPISQQLVHQRVDSADTTPQSVLDYYAATSQQLFPTPSELLSNINHRQQPCQRDVSDSRPYIQPSPPPPRTSRHQSPDDASAPPLNSAVNKSESQRKARQRAIAQEIGFTPTDPYVSCRLFSFSYRFRTRDTISSHEKKRHYLECLEQYVLYLHEQLRLVQTAPLALERVSTYRGLSSRSIRTLLVHMQNTNKTLHEGTLVEEQVVGSTVPPPSDAF